MLSGYYVKVRKSLIARPEIGLVRKVIFVHFKLHK
ncbi:hypothetical protein PRUB_a6014 [Pseudoalteromonas rubra]|uniref:Uncharacterized protein n=1 Tax=Pseudoalteromonas rubra TaxID=43658 RepID=A0A8T0C361_9GAMM|nr:hypothetical protein PRUB_a6014 [Pseudoalteromonas rubra]